MAVNFSPSTVDPSQWVDRCIADKQANSPGDVKACQEEANKAYMPSEIGSKIGDNCTPAPGTSCDTLVQPVAAVPPKPRIKPFGLGIPKAATAPAPAPTTPTKAAAGTAPKQTPPKSTAQVAADKTVAKATQSATHTAPLEPATAQAEAQSDLSMCGSASSSATSCCNNPMACMSAQERQSFSTNTSGGGGLSGSCSSMSQLGSTSTALNNRLSGICAGSQQACYSACGQLISKYQSLADSCNGCASQSIYEQTLSELSYGRNSCSALQTQVNAFARQAAEGNGGATSGDNCQKSAGTPGGMPSSLGGRADSTLPSACESDPNGPACRGTAQARLQDSAGAGAGFQEVGSNTKPNFNPAPMAAQGAPVLPAFRGDTAPNKANVVANNSGGAIPGQGDSGGGARLDSKTQKGGVVASSGPNTDILQGDRSGGYSQPAGGNGSGFENMNGDYSGDRRSGSRGLATASNAVGMDLKKFLPGGSLDPNRHLAGLAKNAEINGKAEDIFQIISNKMVEKCKLGVLWRCE